MRLCLILTLLAVLGMAPATSYVPERPRQALPGTHRVVQQQYPVDIGHNVDSMTLACFEGVQQALQDGASGRDGGQLVAALRQLLRQASRPDSDFDSAPCPPGWSYHQDSCYLIPPQKSSWHTAHHYCAMLDRRAKLASIHHSNGPFIEDMVATFNAKGVWVGLSRHDEGSEWRWSDATGLDHLNWDEKQPTNQPKELCGHLGWQKASNNLLHDNYCTYALNMLCQIDLK